MSDNIDFARFRPLMLSLARALAASEAATIAEFQAYLETVADGGYATPDEVAAAVAALVDSSPAALDTLNELAAALGDDPNFATTMTNALAGKQPLDSDLTAIAALTGNNKFLFRNSAGVWGTRGLGSGLTDDGTNIVASASALPGPVAASIVAGSVQYLRNASGADRTISLALWSAGSSTTVQTSVSSTAAPQTFGAGTNRTVLAGASANTFAGIVVPAGAVLKIASAGTDNVFGTITYTA